MSEASMLKEFLELVQIPVQSRDERKIADVLKKKLLDLGLSVEEDNAAEKLGGNTGNLIARLPGDPDVPSILLSAHMDRVKNPGAIHPVVNEAEGLIKSDGTSILAADDVSGLCAVLEGLRRVRESGRPHGPVEVVFSVCEEIGVQGSGLLDFSKLKSKQAFVFDAPGRIGRIINQAPTKCKIEIKVHGIKAHAGNEPEKGLSAIRVAADAIMHLQEGRITPTVVSNIGVIKGGTGTNVVPDLCEMTAEARSTDDAALEKYLVDFRAAFEDAARRWNTPIDLSIKTLYHTFLVDPQSDIVSTALAALRTVDVEGWCERGGGGMDGNHFNWNGIPAIGLALGYSKNHTNAEQIYMSDLFRAGQVASELIHITCEKAKGSGS
ncbi:M20/M25/M40 family metallo-hydrolase [uncultured Sutterella sp.]|uniref:M20/M25/M40 family metallo-hydrolase n=1 Tax=uncultured Sutterella sp. TaxID=286133 RepID=UPI00261F9C4E|nr:M20/M25/M40 family metallo-hydrolase [uncultured Sutterella sp.]